MKRLLFLFAPAFVLSFSAAAQQAPAQPVFGEEVDVRVVNLEVVVTDRDGNRVSNLKPEDFRLRVDGKDVPVEYFTEVREGQSVAASAAETRTPSLLPARSTTAKTSSDP